jgi:hypothetical protein
MLARGFVAMTGPPDSKHGASSHRLETVTSTEYLHVFFIDPKVIAFSVVRLSPRVAARQQGRILSA